MIRAVLDTNVIVSSLFNPTGTPSRVLKAWRAGMYALCLSERLFAEIQDVLQRPAMVGQLPVAPDQIRSLIRLLARGAEFHRGPLKIEPVIADDPDDDVVLATAVATRADCIVSGDRHLLALKFHRGIPIVPPRQFLEILRDTLSA